MKNTQRKNRLFQVAWLLCAVLSAVALHADIITISSNGTDPVDAVLTQARTYDFTGDYIWELSGNITGNRDLTRTGGGELILSGTNAFGAITLTNGTLTAANSTNSRLSLGTGSGAITYNGGAGSVGTLRFTESATTAITRRQTVSAGATGVMEALNGASVTVTTPSYTSNGGAVYIYTGGKMSVLGDIRFTGNQITGTTFSRAGGAIYNVGALVTDGATFASNSSSKSGGAIYSSGAMNLTETTFTNNVATDKFGGAIYIAGSTATFTGENLTFTGNSSAQYGGAISNGDLAGEARGGTLTLSSSTFTNNKTTGSDGRGGAIFSTDAITGTGLLFEGNTAIRGGAYYSDDQSFRGGTDVFRDTTFNNNHATKSYGGAINTDRGLEGYNLTVTNNTAPYDGGAICNGLAGNMQFEDSTFTGNESGLRGGAIYSTGNGTYTSNLFTSNKALYGGAICTFGIYSTVELISNNFEENEATGGGAIVNWHSRITGSDLRFTNNTAEDGGAFYNNYANNKGAVTELDNTTFTTNTAIGAGGALVNAGIFTGTDVDFIGNTAGDYGGAIFNDGSNGTAGTNGLLTLTGGLFDGNTANVVGGAIATSTLGILTLDAVTFTNNSADGAGGAIYIDSGTLNVHANTGDTSFSGNTAAGTANAIFVENAASDVTVNLAAGAGKTLDFLDPVTGNDTSPAVAVNINSDAADTGTVRFSGENFAAGSDDVMSRIKADTTVSHGTMELTGNAVYGLDNVSGSFTIEADGTLAISSAGAQLLAGDSYTQEAGSTLALDLAGRTTTAAPNVLAANATIESGANLVVTNFAAGDISGITKASDVVTLSHYTFMRTTDGITGEYASVSVNGGSLNYDGDYIAGSVFKSADNLDYNLGYNLAWFAGSGSGHGTFTVGTGETFEIDDLNGLYHDQAGVGLIDQTALAPFASGWDGKSLTKGGDGTLLLTAEAAYTGQTTITAGTLALTGNVSLANSSGVVANGNFDVSGITGGTTSIQALAGAGTVTLGSKTLTFGSSGDDTEFSGVFSGNASSGLTKTGAGTFTISGNSLATFDGTFTQAEGNVHLTGSVGGTYTQAAGTTLTSTHGATLGDATFQGTVTPTGTLKVASAIFDGATVNHFGNLGTDIIAATGAIQFTTAGTTLVLGDLSSHTSADYLLMTGNIVTGMENAVASVTLSADQRGWLYLANADTELYYGLLSGSIDLTWDGTDAAHTWNNNVSANTNWQTDSGTNIFFKNNDTVLFNNAAANKDVIVDAAGVAPNDMNITAGDYTFSGGTVDVAGDFQTSGNTTNATFSNELNVAGDARVSDGATVDLTGDLRVDGVLAGETGQTAGRLNVRGGDSNASINNLGEAGSTLDAHFYIDSSTRGVGSLDVEGTANMDNVTLEATVWGWALLDSDEYTLLNNTNARTGTTTVVNDTLTAYEVIEDATRVYLQYNEDKLAHLWDDPSEAYVFATGSEQGMIKIENGTTESLLMTFLNLSDPALADLLVDYLNAGLGDTSLKFGVYSDGVLILNDGYLPDWSGFFAWDLTDFNIVNNSNVLLYSMAIPEPTTWLLLLTGMAMLGFTARRRMKKSQ